MLRRVAALVLLIVPLALVVAPAYVATLALVRGEHGLAFDAFWPVFLVPLGFLVFGVSSSLRRAERGDGGRDSRRRY